MDRVSELATEICEPLGLELVDVEMSGGILRVTIDHPEGLAVGVVADVTRKLTRLMDDDDPVPGHYTLEVSSPGLERKLRKPPHFIRSIGEQVSVKTSNRAEGGRRSIVGVLSAADENEIRVEVASSSPTAPEGVEVLRYDQIDKASTVFVWDAAPKSNPQSKSPQPRKAVQP